MDGSGVSRRAVQVSAILPNPAGSFSGALWLADCLKLTCDQLKSYGFQQDNTLAAVAICRDEIAEPFLDEVLKS